MSEKRWRVLLGPGADETAIRLTREVLMVPGTSSSTSLAGGLPALAWASSSLASCCMCGALM